jgi:hypothetical protein
MPLKPRHKAVDLPLGLIFSGDFHMPSRKVHFSGLFCDFCLRSTFGLAIVPLRPE